MFTLAMGFTLGFSLAYMILSSGGAGAGAGASQHFPGPPPRPWAADGGSDPHDHDHKVTAAQLCPVQVWLRTPVAATHGADNYIRMSRFNLFTSDV